MKHAYCLLLGLLFLLPPAHLRAQTITMPATGSATYTGCAGTVYDPGGTGNYANNAITEQVLRPTAGTTTSRVRITFTSFNLENSYDNLYIYDGPDNNAPLLATLTGTEGINQTYTATHPSGALTLRFISDPLISAPGFVATLSCAVVPTVGNVGIGTAEPVEKLHVAGTIFSSQGGVRFPDGSVQTSASAPDNLGNHTATRNLGLNGNWLSNAPGTSNGLRIADSGNVGIGTETPNMPLTVQGSGPASQLIALRSSVGTAKWHWNLASNGLNLAESGVADYRLFVKEGGRVGIGTGTPEQALDVAGTARATDFAYNAAQTRYLTVPVSAFVPAAPGSYRLNANLASGSGAALYGNLAGGTTGQSGFVVAPVQLPQGATITSLELTALDDDGTGVAPQLLLAATRPEANSGAVTNIAYSGQLTLPVESPNWQTVSTTTSHVVRNDLYYYNVRVRLNQNSTGTLLLGVRIGYTVAQPD